MLFIDDEPPSFFLFFTKNFSFRSSSALNSPSSGATASKFFVLTLLFSTFSGGAGFSLLTFPLITLLIFCIYLSFAADNCSSESDLIRSSINSFLLLTSPYPGMYSFKGVATIINTVIKINKTVKVLSTMKIFNLDKRKLVIS